VRIDGVEREARYEGVGPVDAVTRLLREHGVPVEVLSLHQTSLASGAGSDALTLIEYRAAAGVGWSAGRHRSVLTASVEAVLRAAGAGRAATS
jgi:2-isopropylmalate synthase